MIRLRYDTTIGGVRHGKGSLLQLGTALEAELLMRGDADTETGIYSRDALGKITGLQGDDGEVIGLQVHPYYHFHGFAGNQFAGESKFYCQATGVNHGERGANLPDSQMFSDPGYVTTGNPTPDAIDSTIHIPNLNFDYVGGEKLIVWWLGKATPEAADAPFLGDGYSSAAGAHGFRIRVKADGKFDSALWGAGISYGAASEGVVFDGTLHSLAIVFDGAARRYGMWSDEVYQWASSSLSEYGLNLVGFNPSEAQDTKNSNTVNIGSSRPASAASSAETDGIVVGTRALVILRLSKGYSLPTVLTLTNIFRQLRTNPSKLILASAF